MVVVARPDHSILLSPILRELWVLDPGLNYPPSSTDQDSSQSERFPPDPQVLCSGRGLQVLTKKRQDLDRQGPTKRRSGLPWLWMQRVPACRHANEA